MEAGHVGQRPISALLLSLGWRLASTGAHAETLPGQKGVQALRPGTNIRAQKNEWRATPTWAPPHNRRENANGATLHELLRKLCCGGGCEVSIRKQRTGKREKRATAPRHETWPPQPNRAPSLAPWHAGSPHILVGEPSRGSEWRQATLASAPSAHFSSLLVSTECRGRPAGHGLGARCGG